MLNRSGFRIELDTSRLNPAEELYAVLAKRRTYEATRQGKSFVVDYRNLIRIEGGRERPILAEHRCTKTATTVWPNYWPKYVYAESEGIPF